MSERLFNPLTKIIEKSAIESAWVPPVVSETDHIPTGDMPGDKIKIGAEHIAKAQKIFPELCKQLMVVLKEQPDSKAVISVHGGSGVGKSEIGSLLSYYFNSMGIGSYILSGDNYPHRIPKYNDAERLRVYRESGLKGLVISKKYTKERNMILQQLQESGKDSDSALEYEFPWITAYQEAGRKGLKAYLGTTNEIDFEEVNNIIAEFKNNSSSIMLKRMGREEKELWYDAIDFSAIQILIIEWTHGNNSNLKGIDIPILLNSTPKETLEHRRLRNRDGAIDSSFTMEVLKIEQELLSSQASKAKIIVTKNGQIISYEELNQMI